MKCLQCGALITEPTGFCPECGARVKVSSSNNNVEKESYEVQQEKNDINYNLIPVKMRAEIEEKYKSDPVLKEQVYRKIIQMMKDKQREVDERTTNIKQSSNELKRETENRGIQTTDNNNSNQQVNNTVKEQASQYYKGEKPGEGIKNIEKSSKKNEDKDSTGTSNHNKKQKNKVQKSSNEISKRNTVKSSRTISEPTNIFSEIFMLVTNPTLSTNDLSWCMSGRSVIRDAILMIVFGCIMTTISFKIITLKMIYALISMFGDFFILMGSSVISASNAEDVTNDIMQTPFIQDTGFKIIIYPLLSHIILIILMSLLILGIFRVLKKEEVTFRGCIMSMLTPLAILFVGKILVFLVAFASGTVAAYLYVLLMPITVVIMIFQLVNLLGVSTFTMYTVPIIYIVSALVRNTVIMELIKGSMSAYTLYF